VKKTKLTDIFAITMVMLLFPFFYCSAFRKGDEGIEKTVTVAVFDFEQEGFLSGGRLDQFTADELTTSLYLKKKVKVVDRSQVVAICVDRKISSSVLNLNEIRQLGTDLNADYLILGKIIRFDDNTFDPENRDEISIQITFRFISTEDGSVAGMANLKHTEKGEVKSTISDMLDKMVDSIKLE